MRIFRLFRRPKVYTQWCIHCEKSYTTSEKFPAPGTYHKRPCYICGLVAHATCRHGVK